MSPFGLPHRFPVRSDSAVTARRAASATRLLAEEVRRGSLAAAISHMAAAGSVRGGTTSRFQRPTW